MANVARPRPRSRRLRIKWAILGLFCQWTIIRVRDDGTVSPLLMVPPWHIRRNLRTIRDLNPGATIAVRLGRG